LDVEDVAKGLRIADEDGALDGLPASSGPSDPLQAAASAARPEATKAKGQLARNSVVHDKYRLLGDPRLVAGELAFKALHLGTGRRVELRVLAQGSAAQSPEAARMLRAARAAGRAPHSNVLNVIDSGHDMEGRPFVVYELFGGVPLTELVARNGPCELAVAVEIMGQLLDGLSALHARGIVHRQLRPENVLVDGGPDALRVKLTGLAYSVQRDRGADALELPRGYSRYLSPEARRGEATTIEAVDLYAAGVLMRFLLTGDAASECELAPEIERAVARATALDAEERFQSAEQFRACVSALSGPSTRESLIPSGALFSDLRFMLKRREVAREEQTALEQGTGRLELYPVLLVIETYYARVGAPGWAALLEQLPAAEHLLPASGSSGRHRSQGVPSELFSELLQQADQLSGRGNLRFVVELGEELARRGLARFCSALPAQLTPECLIACIPNLWRSLAREGEVWTLEQRDGHARVGVRGQLGPTLERSALFAGMLRGQLRLLSPGCELNMHAAQALGDAADVYVLSW
jgi:hypothetical protein